MLNAIPVTRTDPPWWRWWPAVASSLLWAAFTVGATALALSLTPDVLAWAHRFATLTADQQVAAASRGVMLAAGAATIIGIVRICWRQAHRPVSIAAYAVATAAARAGKTAATMLPDPVRAAHEAGHLAAMAHFNWTIHQATIIPAPGSGGHTRGEPMPGCDPSTGTWQHLVVRAAGTLAEHTLPAVTDGGANDMRESLELVARLLTIGVLPPGVTGPLTVDGLITGAAREAAGILAAHQTLLADATDALLEHRDLDHDMILDLLTGDGGGLGL